MSARSSSSVACSAAVRTIRPCWAGLTRSRIAAQALAHVVGQALGDAVRLGVGDQHDEPAGQRHLLGQAGALGADRVLRDLADDQLAGPQDVLDAGAVAALLDVLGVVLHVAAVEHGVLRRGDVDERRLHAGQHVLHPADVDVAVDLADVVGRPADVVLDQVAALEHGDLGHVRAHLDAHEVAPDRPAVALAAAALLDEVGLDAGAAPARRRRRARLRLRLGAARRAARGASARRGRAWPAHGRRPAAGDGGAGRVSPICGLRTSARSAASADARPSRIGSGSSGDAPSASVGVGGSARPSGLRRRWPPRVPRRRLRGGGLAGSSPSAARGRPSGRPAPVRSRPCRSFLMRPPWAPARRPAAPTPRAGLRRARSIDVSVSLGRRAASRWPTPGKATAASSAGRRPRPTVARSATSVRAVGGDRQRHDLRAHVVDAPLALALPLERQRVRREQRGRRPPPCRAPAGTASSHVTDVTISCSDPAAVDARRPRAP